MPKRGIVLAGGGARGPYQVGVWKALRELGVGYEVVTGTSVGALNGAFMVQDDYQPAKEMWERITPGDVMAIPELSGELWEHRGQWRDFMRQLVEHGGLDVTPLEETLRRMVDEEKFRGSLVEFGLVTTEFPRLRPAQLRKEDIPQGALVDYLMASATYFPLFQRRKIGETRYVDGALSDNMPINLAIDCGAQEIIAVDLQAIGITHPYRGQIPITYIRSHWNLGQTLVFSPDNAKRNMQLGYQDAMKAFRRLEGHAYAFPLGETKGGALLLHNSLRHILTCCGLSLERIFRRMPRYHRMLTNGAGKIPYGKAVTTAAEITGELVGVPPAAIYTMEEFNRLCVYHWVGKNQDGAAKNRTLEILYRLVEEGTEQGRLGDSARRLALITPKELMAAIYLLSLKDLFHITSGKNF